MVYKIAECPRCHGRGTVVTGYGTLFGATYGTCPVCDGTGETAKFVWDTTLTEEEYEELFWSERKNRRKYDG